jgi:ABC-type uncharacterized transport system permease subunit
MDIALLTSLLQSTVTMAVPLLLAALGELVAERAGIINIGLEGLVLGGAFAAMAVTYFTGHPELGVLAAWAAGVVLVEFPQRGQWTMAFVVGALGACATPVEPEACRVSP